MEILQIGGQVGAKNFLSEVNQAIPALNELAEKIARLPVEERDLLEVDVQRLRDCLEAQQGEHRYRELSEALEVERAKLAAAIDNLPVGVGIEDTLGNTISLNTAGLKLHGFESEADMLSRLEQYLEEFELRYPDGQLMPFEDWPAARALRGDFVRDYEVILRNKGQGTERVLSYSSAPVLNSQGETVLLSYVFQDMTSRKQVEDALREREMHERARANELAALMDAVPAIIWISRDPQCREMIGNRFGYEFLGMRPGANLSQTAPEEADARQAYQYYKDGRPIPIEELPMQIAAANGKATRDYTFDLVFNDGPIFHLLGNVNPLIDPDGRPTGAVGAFVDITELRRLQAEQIETRAAIELQRRLMDQREQERQGIARDIHDGPVQTLSSTTFHLQFLKETFLDPALQVELSQVSLNIRDAVRELREVVNDLRPPSLIRFGLARTILMHAEDLQERYPEIELKIEAEDQGSPLSDQACLALFRLYQEGMTNIIRHSRASKAWVRFVIDQDTFQLVLRDDGIGFEPPGDFSSLTNEGHFGLAGMRERAEMIGAEFFISSQPGQGALIQIRGPLTSKILKTDRSAG